MSHRRAVALFTTHSGPRQKELDVFGHKSSEECIPQFPYTLENVTKSTPALSAKAGEVGSCRASRGRFCCNGSLHPTQSLDFFFLLLMSYTNMFLLSMGELPVYF